MNKYLLAVFLLFVFHYMCPGQTVNDEKTKILFQGLVMDAKSEIPVPGAQILINNALSSVSDEEGKFAFYVNRRDTVLFTGLGYKPTTMYINDTLSGNEFLAGIYMQNDTVSIAEVIIVPRINNLKSDLLNGRTEVSREMENAKYNMAVSAYQGRVNQNKMGDPDVNYEFLRQKQRSNAYSKGQIPPDRILGISPLLLIPAAYLLMHGLPERPPPLKPSLTDTEVYQIHQKYLESLKQK